MKRLHGMDALLLYTETPTVHTHTLKIGVLDVAQFGGEFSFTVFRDLLWRRLHLLEPFRYQLVPVPGRLHHPVWLENAAIDMDYHVRRAAVPSPGGRRELDALIGQIASTPLDRNRPLWEMHVVEGMADGSLPVIVKIHHVLADGVASGNLLARAMGFTGTAADERTPAPAAIPPSAAELLWAAARDHLRLVANLPRLLVSAGTGAWRLWRASRARGPNPDIAGLLSPAPTFFNHAITSGREFASATVALTDIKQTSKQLGVKINDLALATTAGALRELLLRYDGRADRPLIASVPASLDSDPDRVAGNELGAMNVSLPVHVDDPLERVRLTVLGTGIAKEEFTLLGPELIKSLLEYLPPALAPAMFGWLSRRTGQNKLQNLTVSNVPGPRERSNVGGAMLREFYSVGPLLAGSGLNITVWSYVDQLNISVLTDDHTVRDPHEVTDAMVHAFTEIRRAAGLPGALTPVTTALAAAPAVA
ncbi:wax ester/triacylglycerol synthase family O-acyltransferase [Mycobacterium koreense]|uniref:Diacylglycerol O-acyltransferase n=1 Tax=Mycolicibacillus koreensis TaxID=1069220 RepID=A0A7I7SG60_9MYCO|nr:wax ester/triacylglycerol synthase family O-acyltransferase [Mycolicibacillus koreensis]MCV7247112.1 wax ester/triacylglycerol synthase family O-acyltransferase [Mycolicibacillus koreensis]ODR09873.1 diacylglycerol O-acyltransferase [Mycolicibacillus koreensis]OSC28750.1 wax ester/triacylglycerol synthase family O-acyltransferase [Mycolicibacillus koreensis]BBY55937.1 diacylglycerol O-acyltransferase [Mycolicibacillus koreensis]